MRNVDETKQDEALQQLDTILDFIRWGGSLFNSENIYYGHGTDNALDEAAYLVLRTLHLPPDTHSIYFSANLTVEEKKTVIDILLRRVNERIPAAYLINEAWFAGLCFYVDERVLIPRSPMAELIEQAFEPWLIADEVTRVLDLCTGSACIAIACAYALKNALIDAADISADALVIANKNITNHYLEERVRSVQSDLFVGLKGEKYDLIISNPPYVDAEDMEDLPEEFGYEPVLALEAGNDGLDIIRIILSQAVEYLHEGGILIVEVGNSQLALQEQYPQVPFYWFDFERGGDGVFLLTKEQLGLYSEFFTLNR